MSWQHYLSESTYMFDGLGHGMSIGATQGEVEHHNLIGGYESGDTHDKDQVPEDGEKRAVSVSNDRDTPAASHTEHTLTHLPMRGTESEVSGTFWAIRKRKTVWASKTEMETVNFCPPAVKGTTES